MKKMSKKISVVVALVALCLPAASFAAEKLIVQDSSPTPVNRFVVSDTGNIIAVKDTNSVDKFVVNTIGVGIGTNDPRFPLHIMSAGAGATSQLFFHNKGRTAVATDDSPAINLFRNNDPTVNSGLPRNNDRLGHMTFGSEVAGTKTYIATILSYAEGDWTTVQPSGYLTFQTKRPGATYPEERLRITSTGSVGVGTTAPKSKLHVVGIVEYVDNSAALTAGLTVGAIYRTGDTLKIVH